MIQHSVIFKLRYPKGAPEEAAFLNAASKLAFIPGVEEFEILKQTNPANSFEFGIAMKFSSIQIYRQYSDHPDHKQFVLHYWLKGVQDFLEIDYEPLTAH